MHENVTHNRDHKTFTEFRREVVAFEMSRTRFI
jgi:hypothetical protein